MKSKLGVSFHNRFDIVKNGEFVGYAENIILDQMYNRLCGIASYFTHIHFGRGTGTPTPERTSLFSSIGVKSATDEEKVHAYPTSKWVRKIQIMPEEFVGEVITEVGVGYSSGATNLVTHALIKDAEGNPLSITKGDLDVIVIYATVFITFSENVYWMPVDYNNLLKYLTGSSWPSTSYILLDASADPTGVPMLYTLKSCTKTSDVPNKKIIFETRFGINEGNNPVGLTSVGLQNVYLAFTSDLNAQGFEVSDIPLGVGDGETTLYKLPLNTDLTNLEVLVGGVVVTDFQLSEVDRTEDVYSPITEFGFEYYSGNPAVLSQSNKNSPVILKRISAEPTEGIIRCITGGYAYEVSVYGRIYGILPNGDEVRIINLLRKGAGQSDTSFPSSLYNYEYIKIAVETANTYPSGQMRFMKNKVPAIEFTTPPAVDAPITLAYTTSKIPKTEDYVLDVAIEIQFGEGV